MGTPFKLAFLPLVLEVEATGLAVADPGALGAGAAERRKVAATRRKTGTVMRRTPRPRPAGAPELPGRAVLCIAYLLQKVTKPLHAPQDGLILTTDFFDSNGNSARCCRELHMGQGPPEWEFRRDV
jgi:hypothetical protein